MPIVESKIEVSEEVKSAVVEFVEMIDRATIPAIRAMLQEKHEFTTDGPIGLCLGGRPWLLLWTGMSREFAQLLRELQAENRIFMHPSDRWENRRQGGMQSIRDVNFIPKSDPGEPYWLPICYRIVPSDEKVGVGS